MQKTPMKLGKEIGHGNFGQVFEVQGNSEVVAKVIQNPQSTVESECLAMQVMAENDMMPRCFETRIDTHKTRAVITITMQRLEGPELTCEDFSDLKVQQRLVDISLFASHQGVLVMDAHPGNYLWHKGQVMRVDAIKVPPVSQYGFVSSVPRTLFAHNLYFIDCERTPLLHLYERAFEYQFGISSLVSAMIPSKDMLLKVQHLMRPTQGAKLRRLRVADIPQNSVLKSDPQHVKFVTVAQDQIKVWTLDLATKLQQTLIALSLRGYLIPEENVLNGFGLGTKGKLVCKAVERAELTTPTFEIWLHNSEFDLDELPDDVRKALFLFAFSVRLAFCSKPGLIATSLLNAGAERIQSLKSDVDLLRRWVTFGETPDQPLKHFNRALTQIGVKKTDLGAAFEQLLHYIK